MIKIALKHWIYETCINVLFDKIAENFLPINPTLPKVGESYHYIYCKINTDSIYYTCIITDVNWVLYDGMQGYHSVNFDYISNGGGGILSACINAEYFVFVK